MKTLWIVSGGIEAVAGIRRARELGLHVVVSDRDPGAPGFRWADDGVLASTYDAQETVEAAGEYHRNVRPSMACSRSRRTCRSRRRASPQR